MEPNNIETNVLQEIQDTHKKANGEYKEEAVTETFDSYLGDKYSVCVRFS